LVDADHQWIPAAAHLSSREDRIEALSKANTHKPSLRSIAEAALDTLPRP
jgi:hypothetical protein